MFEIVITADTNDADYVTAINDITQEELDQILPVIEAIKQFNATHVLGSQYNWPRSEHLRKTPHETYAGVLTDDQIELFDEYTPYFEGGIQTIESVVYFPKPTKVVLL